MNRTRSTRRSFLAASGAALGALALDRSALARMLAGGASGKTKHVVLIAFAGGVRSKETIETPQNIPNLMRIANSGVVFPNVKAENVGHYGAAMSIFTGNTEVFGIREVSRSTNPTVFEYLRKQLQLPANAVWLSTNGGDQQVDYAYSNHSKYGGRYGANLIAADGVFNAEFKDILQSFGTPRAPSEAELTIDSKLRGMLDGSAVGGKPRLDDAANTKNIEKFILDEITGKTTGVTGPGAGDVKAIRIATNILRVFKPTLLGVALQNADVAPGSFNGYVETIRRNDAEIGKLLDAIQADPELKDSTAVFVLPEFGRDKNLNERNGLDHGDGSPELLKVGLVASGPEFKQGRIVKEGVATTDVCPTILKLLGGKAEYSHGSPLKGLFA